MRRAEKYQEQKHFKQNMDNSFTAYAMQWASSDAGKAIMQYNAGAYLDTEKGTEKFEKKTSGYFKTRIKWIVGGVIAFAAFLAAFAKIFSMASKYIKVRRRKKEQDETDE
jgi:hypothetical protein